MAYLPSIADRSDVGIRFGERVERNMVSVPIGPARRIALVGRSAYLRAHGVAESPDALREHRCIRERFPSSDALYAWDFAGPRAKRHHAGCGYNRRLDR